MKNKNKNHKPAGVPLVTLSNRDSIIAEQCRIIRSNIQFSSIDKEIQSIVITSSEAGEGKSTISANLAVIMAQSGKKVLLVDADLRKPTVALTFKQENSMGLSTLLSKTDIATKQVIKQTGVANLSILPSGPKPPNPSEMLSSKKMTMVLEELNKNYDYIIYDLPPVISITDAQILAAKVDATILVVKQNQAAKQSVLQANKLLKMANANIIGVIMNGIKKVDGNYYYYG